MGGLDGVGLDLSLVRLSSQGFRYTRSGVVLYLTLTRVVFPIIDIVYNLEILMVSV